MIAQQDYHQPGTYSGLGALDLGSGPCPAPGFVGVDLCGEEEEGFGFRVSGFSSERPSEPKAQSLKPKASSPISRNEPSEAETRNPKPETGSSPRVIYCDLLDGKRWPFEDDSVELLRAWHVIEHIPHERLVVGTTRVKRTVRKGSGFRVQGSGSERLSDAETRNPKPETRISTHFTSIPATQDAFFWFFDEAYRIAKRGCRFELAWPHPQSDGADQDPTHCRRVPVSTLHYLSLAGRQTLRVHHYPVGCNWWIEPGSVVELAHDAELAAFTLPDGSVDIAAAKRAHGVFHEIRATLIKP